MFSGFWYSPHTRTQRHTVAVLSMWHFTTGLSVGLNNGAPPPHPNFLWNNTLGLLFLIKGQKSNRLCEILIAMTPRYHLIILLVWNTFPHLWREGHSIQGHLPHPFWMRATTLENCLCSWIRKGVLKVIIEIALVSAMMKSWQYGLEYDTCSKRLVIVEFMPRESLPELFASCCSVVAVFCVASHPLWRGVGGDVLEAQGNTSRNFLCLGVLPLSYACFFWGSLRRSVPCTAAITFLSQGTENQQAFWPHSADFFPVSECYLHLGYWNCLCIAEVTKPLLWRG